MVEALEADLKLQSLDCSEQPIGSCGLDRLAVLLTWSECALRDLDLCGNGIGDKGATVLARALERPTSLEILGLRNNGISERGVASLADALQSGQCSLKELSLARNKVGDTGAHVLAEALRVSACPILELDLTAVGLGPGGGAALASAVSGNSTLQRLCLRDNNLLDSTATDLAAVLHQSLQSLDLRRTGLTEVGAVAIAKALPRSALSCLDLSGNSIGLAGAAAIGKELPHASCLRELEISCCGLGPEGAVALTEGLRDTIIELTDLRLSRNKLGEAGVRTVAESLSCCHAHLALDLQDNDMHDSGAIYLAEMLKSGLKLRELDVGRNGVTDAGAKELGAMLLTNRTLIALAMPKNKIHDHGVEWLGHGLAANVRLQRLDVSDNPFTDVGVRHLIRNLESNSILQTLMLDGSNASESVVEEAEQLASSVRVIAADDDEEEPAFTSSASSDASGSYDGVMSASDNSESEQEVKKVRPKSADDAKQLAAQAEEAKMLPHALDVLPPRPCMPEGDSRRGALEALLGRGPQTQQARQPKAARAPALAAFGVHLPTASIEDVEEAHGPAPKRELTELSDPHDAMERNFSSWRGELQSGAQRATIVEQNGVHREPAHVRTKRVLRTGPLAD